MEFGGEGRSVRLKRFTSIIQTIFTVILKTGRKLVACFVIKSVRIQQREKPVTSLTLEIMLTGHIRLQKGRKDVATFVC